MLYDRIADLPLSVESLALHQRRRVTASGFERVTTTVELHGDGAVGRGEDVTYQMEDHDPYPMPALDGEYTVDSFSTRLDEMSLWPSPPVRSTSSNYRRWAFESAALDLALRQAETSLAAELDRTRDSVRFVVSTSPESFDRIEQLLEVAPEARFKLDPSPDWSDELLGRLAEMGRVDIVDLKGWYEDPEVATAPDPAFYRRVVDAFPDAIIEDPAVTGDTRPILADHADRVSWDYPITHAGAIEEVPWETRWLNVKPTRFGTLQSLFETIEYAEEAGIEMYGGGQFELGVGRRQIQAIASMFYPDSPNDVAPAGYNDAVLDPDLPVSPLEPSDENGFHL